jgi:hypothetical protein
MGSNQGASVDGAEWFKKENGETGLLRLRFPAGEQNSYSHAKIVVHFSGRGKRHKSSKP